MSETEAEKNIEIWKVKKLIKSLKWLEVMVLP